MWHFLSQKSIQRLTVQIARGLIPSLIPAITAYERLRSTEVQKLIRIDPCMTLGVRALVGVPKVVRVCLTTAVQVFPAAVHDAVPPGFICTTP
jgi:hypothetical protein